MPAVEGLDRDPGTPGQHVVEVPGALVRGRVARPRPAGSRRRPRAARRSVGSAVDQRRAPRRPASRTGPAGARPGRRAGRCRAASRAPRVPQRRGSPRRRAAARPSVHAVGRPCRSRPCTAASTASFAITRYVVYLPPATTTSPGTGCATVCSRESFEVDSDSPASSGRSPAYTPSTSSWVERRRAAPSSRARAGSRCRRADAAGCALSRSQSVSVVPMIQCRPHGITNSTRLLGAQDQPGRRSWIRSRGTTRWMPLDARTWNWPRSPTIAWIVVGPHAGGVDDLPGPDLELARRSRGRCTRTPTTRSPSRRKPTTRARLAHVRAVGGGRARDARPCAGRRRPARRSTGSRRPARPCAGRGDCAARRGGSGGGACGTPAGRAREHAPSRRRARRPAPT